MLLIEAIRVDENTEKKCINKKRDSAKVKP